MMNWTNLCQKIPELLGVSFQHVKNFLKQIEENILS